MDEIGKRTSVFRSVCWVAIFFLIGIGSAPAAELDLHEAIAAREYWATQTELGLQAPNRKHDLRTLFHEGGIRVVDRTGRSSPLLVSFSWARVGRGDSLRSVPPGELRADGARVEIRRPGLVEWYVNDEAGLEQGFTLMERESIGELDGDATQPVVLDLETVGARARLAGEEIELTSGSGERLSYGKLVVVDARGRRLASRFEVPRDDVIRILFDDRGATWPIVIDPLLSGTFDTLFEANQATAQLGYSVASAGDVNGDGYDDVIVGAPFFDAGQADEGAAFILLGSADGIDQVNPVEAHAQIEGNQVNAQFGHAVASAGDVNADGYADVLIGSPLYNAGQLDEGVAWVYLGSPAGIPDGGPANAHAAFESNQANAQMGYSVASAGDVNDDGFDDVIVGSPFHDNGQADEGMAFIYHGSATGFVFGNPTTASTRLESDQIDARFGVSVATAGDVDADGHADVIVGAHTYDGGESDEGAAFVFHGGSTGIAHGSGSTAQTRIESDQIGGGLGLSVASAGDVNGDGYADVIVGAFTYDFALVDCGAAFVFVGSASGVVGTDPETVDAGLIGSQTGEQLGRSVAGAGDLDADGFDDVAVGSMFWSNGESEEGRVSVWFGSPGGVVADGASPDLTLEPNQVQARFGHAVASAGDVDGDGSADLVVGAYRFENGSDTDEGAAFVFEGNGPSIVESVFGFEGTTQPDDAVFGWDVAPPDTIGAVGLDHFVQLTVGSRSVYDKTTGALLSRTAAQGFWQAAGISPSGGYYHLGDQRILFDVNARRWLASSFGGSTDSTNLAISATADPLGAWQAIQDRPVPAGDIADFPTLSVDRDAVAIGTNHFNTTGTSFLGANLLLVPKADLLGASPTLARATRIGFTFPTAGAGPAYMQGVVNRYGSAARSVIVGLGSSGRLSRFFVDGVDGPGAIPTEPAFVGPGFQSILRNARQPDGSRLVQAAFSGAPVNSVVRVGRRVFVTHTLAAFSPDSTYVQWQVLDAVSGNLIDSGVVSAAGFDTYLGAIAVNELGQAVILYNRSGPQTADVDGDGKPDGRITLMAQAFESTAAGGLRPAGRPLRLRVSEVDDYRCGPLVNSPCQTRWGHTAAVTIDPADPRVFYAVGTYAGPWTFRSGQSRSSWHTWIARITTVPEPGFGAAMIAGLLGLAGLARSGKVAQAGTRPSRGPYSPLARAAAEASDRN